MFQTSIETKRNARTDKQQQLFKHRADSKEADTQAKIELSILDAERKRVSDSAMSAFVGVKRLEDEIRELEHQIRTEEKALRSFLES